MSYHSFKRVLGETNLERKCLWWFGICLGVMLFLSFYWYGNTIRARVLERDRSLGRELVRASLLETHFWLEERLTEQAEQSNNGVAPLTLEADSLQQELSVDPDTDVSDSFYRKLVDSIRELGREFQAYTIVPPNDYGEQYYPPKDAVEAELLKRFSDAPNVTDPEERSQLLQWTKDDPPVAFYERFSEDKQTYSYYQGMYALASCVDCHRIAGLGRGSPRENLQEGDLMAVVRVEIDQEQTQRDLARDQSLLWVVPVVIGFISMFLLYFIVRYVIVKPVQHLRDVSNAVREGDVSQRAEIYTGDEFEELAAAFNRMVRRLLRQQDALQEVNGELDSKVDQLAQANMRLFETNRVKSDFLATMSHELRTPLNSILGFSEVLGGIDSLDNKQKRYVGNIQRSGKMLLEMINDILDLAKMESGKMDVRPTEFRIEAVVSALCDMARPLSEKKNIELTAESTPDLPPMRQDQAKIQQVLNNLLSNAIKFTPEGGRITVSVKRDDSGMLRMQVQDTGVGIGQWEQTIIFEKFRQGTSAVPTGDAMTRDYSGTGLGLSIVRELCRLLGGDVSVDSTVGKGSTFTVHLPWTLTVNKNLDAELQKEVAELTRSSTLTAMSGEL